MTTNDLATLWLYAGDLSQRLGWMRRKPRRCVYTVPLLVLLLCLFLCLLYDTLYHTGSWHSFCSLFFMFPCLYFLVYISFLLFLVIVRMHFYFYFLELFFFSFMCICDLVMHGIWNMELVTTEFGKDGRISTNSEYASNWMSVPVG